MPKNATQGDSLGECIAKKCREASAGCTREPAGSQEPRVPEPPLPGLNLRQQHTSELCSESKPMSSLARLHHFCWPAHHGLIPKHFHLTTDWSVKTDLKKIRQYSLHKRYTRDAKARTSTKWHDENRYIKQTPTAKLEGIYSYQKIDLETKCY